MPAYSRFMLLPEGQPEQPRIPAFDLEKTTIAEIGRQLSTELQALDDSFEYFSVSVEITHMKRARLEQPIGRYRWLAVYAVTGGSEGHYVHVDRIYQETEYAQQFTHEALYLCKTFGGYDRAQQIAAYIGRRLDV